MATQIFSSIVSTSSTITNYARLGLASQNELPDMLRELLLIKEPPHLLEAHINKNDFLLRNLRAYEWQIIRTVRENSYHDCDVPLMYKIIRNLKLVPSPTQGWDNNTPPSTSEITIGDDVERIRRIRNEIVHRGNTNVQDSELAKYFSTFKKIASRLESYLSKPEREFVSKIEIAETCCIDNATEQRYLNRLNKLAEHEAQLSMSVAEVYRDLDSLRLNMQGNVSTLQRRIDSVTNEQDEVIRRNIRDQIEKELHKWKQDDDKFVPTRAVQFVLNCLKNENCVTVVGSPGIGETAITRHVALKMEGLGYTVIPITVPTDIRDFYQAGKPTIFVVDDICGNFTANQNMIDSWKQLLGVVERILTENRDKCKVVVSCRSVVYKDKKFSVLVPFISCKSCNMSSTELQLSRSERMKIASVHLGQLGYEIAQKCPYDFFPLLCFLCSRQENVDIKKFFSNPFSVFKDELDSLSCQGEDGKCKICALSLCVIYKNELEEKHLTTNDPTVRVIIDNVCEACGLNIGTSRVKIKEELETLVDTYLKKERNMYQTVHDKFFDFLVYYCSTKMFSCLVEHAVSSLIQERFLWNKILDEEDIDEFIIIIPDDKLALYLNRLVKDWSKEKLRKVFVENINMKNEKFRDALLTDLAQRDLAEQEQLANMTQMYNGTLISCLEVCCRQEYTNFLPWILKQGVAEAQSNSNLTPASSACLVNNKEMIDKLLSLGAEINKSGSTEMTPIHSSRCYNDIKVGVVNLLTEHRSCINNQMFNGSTPFLLALSTNQNIQVLKILLYSSANCNIGLYDSKTIRNKMELVEVWTMEEEMAFWSNWFTDNCLPVVDEYVKQEPDKILEIIGGATPLHMACFKNDIQIIELLLDRNSIINIGKEDGATPLLLACQFGFADVATLLLEHDADREIRRNDGKKAKDMAKQNNHLEIVSLLGNPSVIIYMLE
ncbi:Hypothetical predicted protein [Mytilus galloprovincialis]|uniref:DZIP3-like HEPN domain-containing protein n=1 Tax=Mytilus galloprovincialis TaxID=29158 RepID=A0A8B6HRA4_MYTGA|nr:Hypothetical predicted protein [Mytilus galloprovincialis]